jgi:gamma-glutamyltranspeptidase/glutathione hydrolase
MTVTINAGFGSGRVVEGTGVLLNNEMDDFSARPGTANLYGLVGNEANAVGPRKRMLSSMSPTIVLEAGQPRLLLGSPGGPRIINSVLQVILNHLVFDMPISEAVEAPRTHSQWLPDKLFHEPGALSPETRETLISMGHELQEFRGIGRVNAIAWEDGLWWPAVDPRGDGGAAGY